MKLFSGAISHGVSNGSVFAKIANGYKPLTIFAKTSIVDVWLGSKYAI